MSQGKGSVQVLVHRDVTTGQRCPPLYPLDLQAQVLKTDGVVAVHSALVLQREHQVQILAPASHKRVALLRWRHLKATVELRHIVFSQKAVGFVHCLDPAQSQLLGQSSLPGPEVALATPTGLRRVGGNHLHPQLAQRSSHLRQAMGIDLAPHLRRQPKMAAPVAVQGAEQALALDHLPQRRHDRGRRFFLHQLRIVDLAAGIIQNHDQVVPTLVLKPAMPATVHVQQHAGQRPPRSPLAMRSALAPLGHQTGPLQQAFYPTLAQLHLVLGH